MRRLMVHVLILTVDCQLSEWDAWEQCSLSCGGGAQTRKRKIITEPEFGGISCSTLRQTRPCYINGCPGNGTKKKVIT